MICNDWASQTQCGHKIKKRGHGVYYTVCGCCYILQSPWRKLSPSCLVYVGPPFPETPSMELLKTCNPSSRCTHRINAHTNAPNLSLTRSKGVKFNVNKQWLQEKARAGYPHHIYFLITVTISAWPFFKILLLVHIQSSRSSERLRVRTRRPQWDVERVILRNGRQTYP